MSFKDEFTVILDSTGFFFFFKKYILLYLNDQINTGLYFANPQKLILEDP